MIRLALRQFRTSAWTAVAGLLAVAVVVLATRPHLADAAAAAQRACGSDLHCPARATARMCRSSVPQHPPSTRSDGTRACNRAISRPKVAGSPSSRSSAASSSAWLRVEALARTPCTRDNHVRSAASSGTASSTTGTSAAGTSAAGGSSANVTWLGWAQFYPLLFRLDVGKLQ